MEFQIIEKTFFSPFFYLLNFFGIQKVGIKEFLHPVITIKKFGVHNPLHFFSNPVVSSTLKVMCPNLGQFNPKSHFEKSSIEPIKTNI